MLRDFGLNARTADAALVFYAGHSTQVGGENYLLPIDVTLARGRDVSYEALSLNLVLGEVAQAQKLGLVILDAGNLARIDEVPSDTMVAFSTRPGEFAVESTGSNSPYVNALVKHMQEPGLELAVLFRKVRDTVLEATAYRQEPRTYDALGAEPFYFSQSPVLTGGQGN